MSASSARMTPGAITLENIEWLLDQGMSIVYIKDSLHVTADAVRQLASRHGNTRVGAAFGSKVSA